MKTKTIIHIVGAESSLEHCMTELHREIGGAKLVFSYQKFLSVDYEDIEVFCRKWIQSQVGDNDLIITYGLPTRATRVWMKKAYPKTKFKSYVWEVHHDRISEERIILERSWSLLFDGIFSQARKAMKHGIPSTHELIRHTPLGLVMKFGIDDKKDVKDLIRSLTLHQQKGNSQLKVTADVVCAEAFDVIERNRSIKKICQLIGAGPAVI